MANRIAPSLRRLIVHCLSGLAVVALLGPIPAFAQESPTTQPSRTQEELPPDPARVRVAANSALDWLLSQQVSSGAEQGSWSGGTSPTAVTSLVGMAYLSHGVQPGKGKMGRSLDSAMAYIQKSMTPEGYIGSRGNSMYAHALCTLFALSYLGQSGDAAKDAELARWCRRAIDVILQAQRVRKSPAEQGGWRYAPDSNESDLSVTAWQLLALQAARQCGFDMEQSAFDDALRYVNSGLRETPGGGVGFLYRPGMSKDPEPDVTGAAVAVKLLIERPIDPRVLRTATFLEGFPPAWGGVQYKGFFYSFSFYQSLGCFQLGEQSWSRFGPALQRLLIERQSGDGRWPFPPDGDQENRASGPAYATAMALLILGLDHQYLPIFQRQNSSLELMR